MDEELTNRIKLAVQRVIEIAVEEIAVEGLSQGLRLGARRLVDESKGTSDDALRGTFLAMAVREVIKRHLGGATANAAAKLLVGTNVGVEPIWEMIPQGFKESMSTYANEYPNQLRYVLNPVWVVDAIRDANPSLAEYFTDHPSGKFWLEGIISGIRAKLSV